MTRMTEGLEESFHEFPQKKLGSFFCFLTLTLDIAVAPLFSFSSYWRNDTQIRKG